MGGERGRGEREGREGERTGGEVVAWQRCGVGAGAAVPPVLALPDSLPRFLLALWMCPCWLKARGAAPSRPGSPLSFVVVPSLLGSVRGSCAVVGRSFVGFCSPGGDLVVVARGRGGVGGGATMVGSGSGGGGRSRTNQHEAM
jgi:hypothetical protein